MSDPDFLALPSPFDVAPGQVLLREPPDADPTVLAARLRAGTYEHPFVVDDGEHLTLYLGSIDLIQTVMDKRAPEALMPGYGQAMMSFLLFHPRPRRIVLIGLGGGALVKACRRLLPQVCIEAVEVDPAILQWRTLFRIPLDDARFVLHAGDGADYLAAHIGGIDVLLVDAFDDSGFAPALDQHAFVADAWTALGPKGIMVTNLAGPAAAYGEFLMAVRSVFDDQLLVVPVRDDGNHILLAFKDPSMRPVWHRQHRLAADLETRTGLALRQCVEQAERVGWRRLPDSLFGT